MIPEGGRRGTRTSRRSRRILNIVSGNATHAGVVKYFTGLSHVPVLPNYCGWRCGNPGARPVACHLDGVDVTIRCNGPMACIDAASSANS